jgi:hypothetical protein
MVTQFDEKGKIFTQVVSKRPVQVIIQTVQNTIRGAIHVRQDSRVKDELSGTERFLAVTGAVVYNSNSDKEVFRSEFLVVNVSHIVWVIPEEDLAS